MQAWIPVLLSAASLLFATFVFFSNRNRQNEQIKTDSFDKLVEKVNKLEIEHAEINVKLAVFWRDVSFDAAKILHRPHPDAAVMDNLIDKYLADQLKDTDLRDLIKLLEATRDDGNLFEGRRLAASQMLRAIKQRYELLEY